MPLSFGMENKRAVLAALSEPTVLGRIAGVVDLGAGAGAWRKLSREFPIGDKPWTAVEAYLPYVGRFELRRLYDVVRITDMRLIKYGAYGGHVFVFGDVLEHMERAHALDVVRRAASMGTVVIVMPFHPSRSAEQDGAGVPWERHRYIWRWEEWLEALHDLGVEPEIVEAPNGHDRNKGTLICWHVSHSYWERRKHMEYYVVVRELIEECSPRDSFLDVGGADTPVATWGEFERRYSCDLRRRNRSSEVKSNVGDFLEWEVPERMSVITCLQVLEHLSDDVVVPFARKLLASAEVVIVSVPFRWRRGQEPSHAQDPIDHDKLERFMGRAPSRSSIIVDGKYRRLVAVYGEPCWT